MSKIAKTQMNIISYAVQEYMDEHMKGIHLYDKTMVLDVESPILYGVNWAALGTQSTEDTKKFAENLMKATKIAEELNKLELVIDYEMKCDLDNIEDKEEKRDRFYRKVWYIKRLLESDMFTAFSVALECVKNNGINEAE